VKCAMLDKESAAKVVATRSPRISAQIFECADSLRNAAMSRKHQDLGKVLDHYLAELSLKRFSASSTENGVPEGSLAGLFGCSNMASELVSAADVQWKLMCGVGHGDLGRGGGVRIGFGWTSRGNRAENLQPDSLQEPRSRS